MSPSDCLSRMTDCAIEMAAARSRSSSGSSHATAEAEVESAKQRCRSLTERIHALPPSRIANHSCMRTLLKLAAAELNFLSRSSPSPPLPLSTNIGYLEAVVHVLQQPFVSGVSLVCKRISLSSQKRVKDGPFPNGVHVDIVCTIGRDPVWFIISDRNPEYISWSGSHRDKGLRMRIKQTLDAAYSASTLMPTFLIYFFSSGVKVDVANKLKDEFGAVEFESEFTLCDFDVFEEVDEGWVYLAERSKFLSSSMGDISVRSFSSARAFQIKLENVNNSVPMLDNAIKDPFVGVSDTELSLHGSAASCAKVDEYFGGLSTDEFGSIISPMTSKFKNLVGAQPEALSGEALINLDTTALIAIVSGISNGGSRRMLFATETEMRNRFKGNTKFIIEQALSEIQKPILVYLRGALHGKQGIICQSVQSEFMELVSTYGGPMEKARASHLLQCLLVVADCPSLRMVGLPTTRKIAMKNKIIFGTGDYWGAPTLTANMGFVRAISQTGMSLITIEHRPRALIGD